MSNEPTEVISKPVFLGKTDIMATEKTNIMAEENLQVINTPEFIEVSDCDLHSHFSFLYNIVHADKLDILNGEK